MGFNEKVHAYLAARYYVRLTDRFGERGKAAFIQYGRQGETTHQGTAPTVSM